jgi:methylated-DNA-protein-cysteine methyltransferase-like protein
MTPARNLDVRIIDVIRLLQPGEVVSYGDVASDAGSPKAARHVGKVLAGASDLSWWRVVTSHGRLVPGSELEQARLLRAEGVVVEQGRVKVSLSGRFADR